MHQVEVALDEPWLVRPAGQRVATDLAQHRADLQAYSGADVAPREAADGDVLAGPSGSYRVPIRPEVVDHLRAPDAQRLPCPAVVQARGLAIADHARPRDLRRIDRQLRQTSG